VDAQVIGEPLANANLYRQFQTLEALSVEDRTTVISSIDVILANRHRENAIKPVESTDQRLKRGFN
jgi:hypothetical protein